MCICVCYVGVYDICVRLVCNTRLCGGYEVSLCTLVICRRNRYILVLSAARKATLNAHGGFDELSTRVCFPHTTLLQGSEQRYTWELVLRQSL